MIKNSHIYKHIQQTRHSKPQENEFFILQTSFKNFKRRKLAEAIQIRNHRPSLNTQEQSYPLKLFR